MSEPVLPPRRPSVGRVAGFVVLLGVVALALAVFSAFPWAATAPDAAMLKVAFKRVSPFEETGPRALSPEELEKLAKHMRPQSAERARTGRRGDTILRVLLDSRPLLDRRYRPGGIRRDGPTFGYEEIRVTPGRYRLQVVLVDARADSGHGARGGIAGGLSREWRLDREVEIGPGRVLLVEFSEAAGLTAR